MSSSQPTAPAQPAADTDIDTAAAVDPAVVDRLAKNPATTMALAATLVINEWPELRMAVAEALGGPDSDDKRDWMANEIAAMAAIPDGTVPAAGQQQLQADEKEKDLDLADDIADQLEAMLAAEFETEIESEESVNAVARQIVSLRRRLLHGDASASSEIYVRYKRWQAQKHIAPKAVRVNESEDESGEEDDDDDEAPQLKPKKEKEEDEVDEDGFTTVKRKGRR